MSISFNRGFGAQAIFTAASYISQLAQIKPRWHHLVPDRAHVMHNRFPECFGSTTSLSESMKKPTLNCFIDLINVILHVDTMTCMIWYWCPCTCIVVSLVNCNNSSVIIYTWRVLPTKLYWLFILWLVHFMSY